jgi:uncharacterized protein
MNILVIADDEMIKSRLTESKADVVVSCGDLPDDVIVEAARRGSCKQILAVKGNHDSVASFPAPIFDLHLKTLDFRGLRFGGFSGSWKYKPKGHHLFEQSEVEAALDTFPKVDVFISHNSPRLIHDRDDEVHIGFVAFNNYITKHKPRFVLHGHQHVQQETLVDTTRVIGTYGFRWLVIPE